MAISTPGKVQLEQLSAMVERVTFHNPDNGFCVLRVKTRYQRELQTVVGYVATIAAGEYVECVGHWQQNRQHGAQFVADKIQVATPTSLPGIEKYLGSGLIKGIGPHYAKKLVETFSYQVLQVIEEDPQQLRRVEGIGEVRLQKIISAWQEQKNVREIMLFLHAHGVGTARAVRIYRTYGKNAIEQLRENPYRLAIDIHGIGFKTADQLAERLGVARDSPLRAEAGVLHVVQQMCGEGHCLVLQSDLVAETIKLLEIEESAVANAITQGLQNKLLVADTLHHAPCIYPANLYHAEQNVVKECVRIQKNSVLPWGHIDISKAIPWVEERVKIQLSPSQQQAIYLVLTNKVSIITGGPGVGKTTVLNSILKILRAKKIKLALCAPTGRAAKRMSEVTGMEAKTIHRLLEYEPGQGKFKHNSDWPLKLDLLVVDEASMIDVNLMAQLLKAIPSHAALLIVGDVDQLPSVGPGTVLADLIASETICTVRLQEIFRQAADSQIIVNAHRINRAELPTANLGESDFYCLYCQEPEEIENKLLGLVATRIPKKLKVSAVKDIQVLSPMNRGLLGAKNLNQKLQKILNPNPLQTIEKFGVLYGTGDKVIQNVNNYDKDIFNGDLGIIQDIDEQEGVVKINFDGRVVSYDHSELDEIALAYATSIHKSQGSEYPVVVIPLATQHYTLLAKNLIYTAVTRGKRMVVVIAQKKAFILAVKNISQKQRLTKLAEKLQHAQMHAGSA